MSGSPVPAIVREFRAERRGYTLIRLLWAAASFAVSYRIEIDGRGDITTADQFVDVAGLDPDTEYTARIYSVASNGDESGPATTAFRTEVATVANAASPFLNSNVFERRIPLRMGRTNLVPGAQIAAFPEPVTPLRNLRTEHISEIARWVSLDEVGEITIDVAFDDDQTIEYFAFPGAQVPPTAEIRVELFDELGAPLAGLGVDNIDPGSLIALGVFRAGIDPYGGTTIGPSDADFRPFGSSLSLGIDPFNAADGLAAPYTLVSWLNRPYTFRSLRFTLRPNYAPGDAIDLRLRTMLLGEKLEFSNGFAVGAEMSYLSPPRIRRLSSGRYVSSSLQTTSRQVSLSLPLMSRTDRYALSALETSLRGQPFITSAHPGATGPKLHDHNILGMFANSVTYRERESSRYAANNVTIVEA